MPAKDKSAKLFEGYIKTRKILIADSSNSSRAGLAKTMVGLGAKTSNIVLAAKYQIATEEMTKIKPHVVLCDYDLNGGCGLDLLQKQRNELPEAKDSLFILVTGNTSQSTVAQAAEEDVDTYILKPYTVEVLRQSIMRAAVSKINPSDYVKKVEEGKLILFDEKNPEKAMKVFEAAFELDPKPALALFYHGQAELIKEFLDNAEGDFKKGLESNKIHYKCLVGLYEVLMSKKEYKEAYDIIKRISRYFPANPQRLASVLRLAIMTKNYEDIERYYQIFTAMDHRNEELIKYICASLVVCGKFYLRQNIQSRALPLFQKAATTAAGRTKILREIITELVSADLFKEAEEYLRKFPAETQDKADYLSMDLMIKDRLLPASKVIELGRGHIQNGIEDPLIYRTLIRLSAKEGLTSSAEQMAQDAAKKWPEQKESFLKIIHEFVEEEEDEEDEEEEKSA